MHRPALVTPATELPVSIEEVKLSLRIDGDDLDSEIESQIKSAVQHYEGWNGTLGISVSSQQWRQDFDRFDRSLCLPMGPAVAAGMSVSWRNAAGQISTVPTTAYVLRIDPAGRASVRFDAGYSFPNDLHESGAVSVTYTAGYDPVPEDIKTAIKLRVQTMIDEAAKADSQHLERIEEALIGKYRRMGI